VKVKVVRVDMESTKIDFTLESEKSEPSEKGGTLENIAAPTFNLGAWGEKESKKEKKTIPNKAGTAKTGEGKTVPAKTGAGKKGTGKTGKKNG
jgi:hypothetical protein